MGEELKDYFNEFFMQSFDDVLSSFPLGVIVLKEQDKSIYFSNKIYSILNITKEQQSIEELPDFLNNLWDSIGDGESLYGITNYNGKRLCYAIEKKHTSIHDGLIILFELSQYIETLVTGDEPYEIESLLNLSFDELFISDSEGKVLWISSSCEKNYGLTQEQITGQYVTDLEESGIFFPSATRMTLSSRERVTIIQETSMGEKFIVTANPIFDREGKLFRVVSNSRKVSELYRVRSKLEEVLECTNNYNGENNYMFEDTNRKRMVGKSENMEQVMSLAQKVSIVDVTVLLEGETGCGKSMLANTIHEMSLRNKGPFIEVDCSTIPPHLIESELFGYTSGSFTGANKQGKKGIIEAAEGGTLFLDEIGEIPMNLQIKLLRLIQDHSITKIGSNKLIHVNIRIIAATNKNLAKMVDEGKFRKDLYYRLNVVPIYIAPLRERPEDISLLVDHFAHTLNEKYKSNKKMSSETLESIYNYDWPGNIRELENIMERLWVVSDGDLIKISKLSETIRNFPLEGKDKTVNSKSILSRAIDDVERRILLESWHMYQNTYLMAEHLGISQATVVRKLQKYKIRK